MRRFADWIGALELAPAREAKASEAVELVCDDSGNWKGHAFFLYEKNGWTVFNDMTGYMGGVSAQTWLRLSFNEDLTFMAYNDAIRYGELVIIEDCKLVRHFFEDSGSSNVNVDLGRLEFEATDPIKSWMEVASVVDEDEMGEEPSAGLLWVFR